MTSHVNERHSSQRGLKPFFFTEPVRAVVTREEVDATEAVEGPGDTLRVLLEIVFEAVEVSDLKGERAQSGIWTETSTYGSTTLLSTISRPSESFRLGSC